jgi:5-methylcytosine-specific restriction endonuclease McrA
MKLLVAALEKQKFAVNERPRQRVEPSERGEPSPPLRQRGDAGAGTEGNADIKSSADVGASAEESADVEPNAGGAPTEPRRRGEMSADGELPPDPRQRGDVSQSREPPVAAPRQRYIPAAVRREVYHRDGARCAYVDARGVRCPETRYLELHHLQPFALHGAHEVSNLALRCSAHNALAADEDFGKNLVAERQRSRRHEAFALQQS